MMERNTMLDELENEYMDELIRLAFKYEDALVAQQLAAGEPDVPLAAEEEQLAARSLRTAWQKAEKAEKEQRRSGRQGTAAFVFRRLIPYAACIVLLVGIALPVAIASSAYLRAKVVELLICIDGKQNTARFFFGEDETQPVAVPAEWEGSCFPTYLPEGYAVAAYNAWKDMYYVIEYSDGVDGMVKFQENVSGTGGISGVEGAEVSHISINGRTALVIRIQESGYTEIHWDTDDRWLRLETKGVDYEEAIRIAESVGSI